MATNQGPSSTQDNEVKKPFMMPTPDNIAGNESGVSDTAGRGTTSGEISTGVDYSIKPPATPNGERPSQINIPASETDNSAKWQNREQDQGAGADQY